MFALAGKLVYAGDAEKATSFFMGQGLTCPMNFNPAEFWIDSISVDQTSKETADKSNERIASLCENFAEINPASKFFNRVQTSLVV